MAHETRRRVETGSPRIRPEYRELDQKARHESPYTQRPGHIDTAVEATVSGADAKTRVVRAPSGAETEIARPGLTRRAAPSPGLPLRL